MTNMRASGGVVLFAVAALWMAPASPVVSCAWADGGQALDLSAAFNVDLIGSDAEVAAANNVHTDNPVADYTLHDVFGDHWRLGAMYDCYYSNNDNGLPTSGQIATTTGNSYQLGLASVTDPVTQHTQAKSNAIGFGKPFGTDRASATVTLSAVQQGCYSGVNFLAVHWYSGSISGNDTNRTVRLYADYATGSAGLLYEGTLPSWRDASHPSCVPAFTAKCYVGSAGTSPRGVTILSTSRKVWEFAADSANPTALPLKVDATRVLTGFHFETAETSADAEEYSVILAAVAQRSQAGVTPLTVAAGQNYTWCYENTAQTTLDRHMVVLTVSVAQPDPNGNTTYAVQVCQTGGTGTVTIKSTADPLIWQIVGGRRAAKAAGPVQLEITATGNEYGGQGQTSASLTVRLLGDINGDGQVKTSDRAIMVMRLNSSVPLSGYDDRQFDLNGDGQVKTSDRAALVSILNGGTLL